MPEQAHRKNLRIAVVSAAVAVGMVGLSYASVPVYSLFCQLTGFGGTTQRATSAPETVIDRNMTIRFDANMAGSLGWDFRPEQLAMRVKVGEEHLTHYLARNTSDVPMTGSAVFNVTPPSAGAYFNKIQCFCFTEQTLQSGESMNFPVVFFVDPAIADDPDLDAVDTITLSYTFYPVDNPNRISSAAPPQRAITN